MEIFLDFIKPPSTLIIVGGVHIAIALASIAKTIGYCTIIIDPRKSFGSVDRFPGVDQIINEWPKKAFSRLKLTKSTAVAVLTHDRKIDDPTLESVLGSPAFYIGALGSRDTHKKRLKRLQGKGFSQLQLREIHGPIGLDIGSRTPEEIALGVMAEIVKAKNK